MRVGCNSSISSPFRATMFQAVGLNATERSETYRDVADAFTMVENASMSSLIAAQAEVKIFGSFSALNFLRTSHGHRLACWGTPWILCNIHLVIDCYYVLLNSWGTVPFLVVFTMMERVSRLRNPIIYCSAVRPALISLPVGFLYA